MGIIAWIVFGAIVGWIASIIAGTNAQQGLLGNIIVGIIGAFIGGFVFSLFGEDGPMKFNLYSMFVALVGAVILLFIMKAFRGRA
jgi:uncharacterized membrane protein YeaQ/YmgE (transglycosylase-associated protein family)